LLTLPEIYVSTDIEADGFEPGVNSILSIGSVALLEDKTILDTFTLNLQPLPDTSPSPATMRWWRQFPEAWIACQINPQEPAIAMQKYLRWLKGLPGNIIFVGHPIVFDFAFINYYLMRLVGENPFGFAAIDIRSFAMGMMGNSFQSSHPDAMPAAWRENLPHTHIALDDALEQGVLFCNLLAQAKKRA
jgi:DNA polymerase III alpha subunit (gram-positive type)